MDDDIYGDLEVSSSSSDEAEDNGEEDAATCPNPRPETSYPAAASSATVDFDYSCPPESSGVINDLRQTEAASSDAHIEYANATPAGASGDDDDYLNTMDLMDEGLTNKFKKSTASDPTRARDNQKQLLTRSNDVQLEKYKHEIAQLKKANAQLESNLVLLYKTSHHIINMKDREFTKLKNKYDAMCFRRNREANNASLLPAIGPQASIGSGTRELAQKVHVPASTAAGPPVEETTSERDMRSELAMLRNYLPKYARRGGSESSAKSFGSTDSRMDQSVENRRRSRESDELPRACRESRGLGQGRRREDRRAAIDTYHRDRGGGGRRDDRDKLEWEGRPYRDHRGWRPERERRDWKRSSPCRHERDHRYRKGDLEYEKENPKRFKGQGMRRTPEETGGRSHPPRKETHDMGRRDRRDPSSCYSMDRTKKTWADASRGCSPTQATCTIEERTGVDTKATLHDFVEPTKTCSDEFSTKEPAANDESAKEDGEISDVETENKTRSTQELRRSPRKLMRGTADCRSGTKPKGPEGEQSRSSSRSVQRSTARSRSRPRSPSVLQHANSGDDYKTFAATHRDKDPGSPKRSVKKTTGEDTKLTRDATPNDASVAAGRRELDDDSAVNVNLMASLRRSPRKLAKAHLVTIASPHTSQISPTKGDSLRRLPVLRGCPCKIPFRTTDVLEDPRTQETLRESILLIIPPFASVMPEEEVRGEYTGRPKKSKDAHDDTSRNALSSSIDPPVRRSPRKTQRAPPAQSSTSCSSEGGTPVSSRHASDRLSGDLTFFDQLPLRQRNSLNSDIDKPRTPTLSPLPSPATPSDGGFGTPGMAPPYMMVGTGFQEWHDVVHFTPFDPSVPPETPGKDFTLATPVSTVAKNGRIPDDIGRILQFDAVK